MTRQQRAQFRSVAGKTPAELNALEPDLVCLGKHLLQRSIGSQFRHVVVDPGNGAHSKTDTHSPSPERSARCRAYAPWAVTTSARFDTSGTATSHQVPPSAVAIAGSVSITMHSTPPARPAS